MSRSMKFGVATVVAALAVSLVATDEAEALFRRGRRHRGHGGGCGYNACCGAQPVGCCGVAVSGCETGACGVATSGCPSGACGVAMGGYSGGYSAGYGSSVQGPNGSALPPPAPGTFDQGPPPPSASGAGTLREERRDLNGSAQGRSTDRSEDRGARSPSDRGPSSSDAAERSSQPPSGADRSAPPPPPQEQ